MITKLDTQTTMRLAITLLIAATMGCSEQTSNTRNTSTPVTEQDSQESEQLRLTPPADWTLSASVSEPNFRRAHYTDGNNESLIVESFPIATATADAAEPIKYTDALAKQIASECTRFTEHNTFAGYEQGNATSVRLFLCSEHQVRKRSEATMLKAIRGQTNFYSIARQRWIDGAIDADSGADLAAELASWALTYKSIFVCQHNSATPECAADHADSSN